MKPTKTIPEMIKEAVDEDAKLNAEVKARFKKPQKAMTDSERLNEEFKEIDYCNGEITEPRILSLMKWARQQGIEQGKCNGCICKSMAERAVADTEIYDKGLKAGFDIGWKESEISLKTKLISDEVCIAIEESGGSFYDAKGIRKLLSVALAEAERK